MDRISEGDIQRLKVCACMRVKGESKKWKKRKRINKKQNAMIPIRNRECKLYTI